MSNSISIGTTILNATMNGINQRTPIEHLLFESDKEEEYPFKSLSTCVYDGREILF